MARISELEQRGEDTLEVAIKPFEFDTLGTADPLELRVTILDNNGAQLTDFLLSTDPADWALDPVSGEYVLVAPLDGDVLGNHRTDWDGIVLSSVNDTGLDTVEHALMIAPFNEAADADGALGTTVTAADHIPVGTPLQLIDQSNVVGTGTGASLYFDSTDPDTPIVTTEPNIGSSGTGPFVCFAKGTRIRCVSGSKPVELLEVGDLVVTAHNGLQPIRWIGRLEFSFNDLIGNERKRPVRISAGALGNGLPETDLVVSRQHRMVISSAAAQDVTGEPEVLVAAHRLARLRRVSVVCPDRGVSYYHILFDRHELVNANGAWTESLYLGTQALQTLALNFSLELEDAADEPGGPPAALLIPNNQEQNQIVSKLVEQETDGPLSPFSPQRAENEPKAI